MERATKRRWGRAVFGLCVTLAFTWVLLRHTDIASFTAAFTRVSLPHLLPALGFLAAGYAVRIVRWWFMLKALEPRLALSACVWPFLSSVAVNNVMPFRAGDALRILGFRRQLLSPPMRVLGTLVVERLLDLVALLGFFFVGLIGLTAGAFPEKLVVIGAWLAGASLAGLFAIILLAPRLPRLIQSIADRPSFSERGLSEMVQRFGANFAEALSLVRSPARLFALFSLSLVAWVFEGAVFATVAFAFDGGATPLAPWFSLATATLATLLPSSPGYLGTFDYFAVLGMTSYGYPREAALAFALVVHALLWLPLTVLGLAYLLIRGDSIWRRSAAMSAASED